MKFNRRASEAEAFRYDIDPVPDWFDRLIQDGRVAVFENSAGRAIKACLAQDGYCIPIFRGSVIYTVDTFPGEIFVRDSMTEFLKIYERAKDDE